MDFTDNFTSNDNLTGVLMNYTMTNTTVNPRMELVEQHLTYILPVLGAVVLPFSIFNIYLLYLTDGERRPSHYLYINLLVADMLAVLGGLCLVVHIRWTDKFSMWLFNNMIWLSFYAGVPLLFGLVLIRILARHMEVSNWVSYGLKTAKIVTAISWFIAFGVTILHDSMKFGTIGSVIKDVCIMCVVIPTCTMNLYVWITLRGLRHKNDALYKAAVTALLLFLNFLTCYAYFTGCYVFFIYTVVTGNSSCSTATWPGLLFCTDEGRHYLGECFMLLQSLGNNLVLVWSSARVAGIVVRYHWKVAREFFSKSEKREDQPLLSQC